LFDKFEIEANQMEAKILASKMESNQDTEQVADQHE